MIIGKRIIYSGRVQGVGFRYTTHSIAQQYAVSGFVRNLPHGLVEVVVEGEPEEIDAFLQAIADRMAEYIRDRKITEHPVTGFKGFEIRT